MFITVLSINHNIAPISVREKIAFPQVDLNIALTQLKSIDGINAGVILSTCNRLEIYINSSCNNIKQQLIKFLTDYHNISKKYIEKYIDYREGENALKHICSVASGLDSLVVGEPQILGQLKTAYTISKQNKTLNNMLEKLFQHVFMVAKKVRTNTEIGKNPVSIAYCGIKISEKIFSDLSKQTALLIGAGEMIELSAMHLTRKNINKIIIANRTKANAEKITKKYNALAINLNQINEYIHTADILITSTAAPIAIIGKGLIESAIKKRKHKPMLILDIAVPRDVESEVSTLSDVYLYTIDDISQIIDENINNRNQAKDMALDIINEQSKLFINYISNIPKQDIIKNYQHNANIIKQKLLTETLKKITDEDIKHLVTKLADQLTNKLLHNNFTNIKQVENKHLSNCQNCIPKIK